MTEIGETYLMPDDSQIQKDFNDRVLETVDQNVRNIVDIVRKGQELSHDRAVRRLGIDRLILLAFAASLLGSLMVMFYLVINDKASAATSILYPLIFLVVGLMGGYFASTGGRGGRG